MAITFGKTHKRVVKISKPVGGDQVAAYEKKRDNIVKKAKKSKTKSKK